MEAGDLPAAELPAFIVEVPADAKNGDIASNIAMAGARTWRKAPKMIAETLLAHLPSLTDSCFTRAEGSRPRLHQPVPVPRLLGWRGHGGLQLLPLRPDRSRARARSTTSSSSRPTPPAPMHMGNARGGALGDCLAAVLEWAGYDVTREFYINDAGNQIQKFGKSLAIRYLQHYYDETAYPMPKEMLPGRGHHPAGPGVRRPGGGQVRPALPRPAGRGPVRERGLCRPEGRPGALRPAQDIAALKEDLGKYRIQYDVWFPESTLHQSGAVQKVVDLLLEKGACYKGEDGAILYRSAQYAAKYGAANKKKTDDGAPEEDKDEVLVRANGIPTYFAADIAYHYNKLATRGFDRAIDVWGADHHGHVARMKGAMDAIGLDGSRLDVVLMQMVNLMQNGQPVRNVQADRQRHHPHRPAGGGAHRQRPFPL